MSEQVTGTGSGARVGIVMGSDSDWPVMQAAAEACREFDVEIEADVVSAHRLDGMDSLLSIVQMPAGVPVATVAVGNARNAGLLAVRILAASDPGLRERMVAFQASLRDSAHAKGEVVRREAQPERRLGF